MGCRLIIVGAETPVGELVIEQIAAREVPINELLVLAEDPYETDPVSFRKQKVFPKAIDEFKFAATDLVIFLTAYEHHKRYIDSACSAGCYVIDSTYTSELSPTSLLVVPEVNAERLQDIPPGTLVINPSASSIFLAMLLAPLRNITQIESVAVSCLLPAVAFGKQAMDELVGQTAKLLNGMPVKKTVFSQQLAFNVLAQSSAADEHGFSEHERRLVEQTRQLMADNSLQIFPSCSPSPVFYAQSLALTLQLADPITVAALETAYKKAPGVRLVPNTKTGPSAVSDATGKDDIFVGRIRQWPGENRQVSLWCVADELRKGAAVNAVQIAEILIKSYL